jgi:hypothetical protein
MPGERGQPVWSGGLGLAFQIPRPRSHRLRIRSRPWRGPYRSRFSLLFPLKRERRLFQKKICLLRDARQ